MIMRNLRWNITCWTCPKVQMTQYVENRDVDILMQQGLPAAMPPCGFAGEKCIPPDYSTLVIALASVAAFVLFLILLHFMRKSYQNSRLATMIWRLDSALITADQV